MVRRAFICYSSSEASIAEKIELALEQEGWDTFRDRTDLPPTEAYHERIREAIEAADRFIFLISPTSVAPGRYTLSELEFARRRWPNPSGKILPVMVKPVDRALIPEYLLAVTLIEPKGDVAAEVVAALAATPLGWKDRLGGKGRSAAVAVVVALIAAGGVWGYQYRAHRQAIQEQVAEATQAAGLAQQGGNYPAAWASLNRAAELTPEDRQVWVARQRLAMAWLDNIRGSQSPTGHFTDIVKELRPVLERGAAGGEAFSADILAHLGWADFLLIREGATGLDPIQYYKRSVDIDPHNPFGHTMWAFELLRTGRPVEEAMAHFEQALKAGREKDYVRHMQFAALLRWVHDPRFEEAAVRVANEMRTQGETLPQEIGARNVTDWLWSVYSDRLVNGYERDGFLTALPVEANLATFQWLFPEDAVEGGIRLSYLVARAQLEERAGRLEEARASYRQAKEAIGRDWENGGRTVDLIRAGETRLRL